VVRGYAWSLVYAIIAYALLLRRYCGHFNRKEVGDMVSRVVDFLNELDKLSPSLGVIAWAHALTSALRYEYVRRLMKEALRIDVVGKDVVGKASEVLEELNDMRERVQELMSDEEFMSYIESRFVKADEEVVKKEIVEAASLLKNALAIYRLNNDELDEAKKLFNKAAEGRWEIGDYRNYLVGSRWALRVETIEGSLVGEKLVNEFRRLYEETFNKKHFKLTASYLSIASGTLGEYLVSLALKGDQETINKLLEEHLWVLNAVRRVSVLTRLMLNALLSPRGGLSGKLEGKLSVSPEELINAFESDMHSEFLPALRVALGIEIVSKPEDGIKLCEKINVVDCVDSVLAAKGNSAALEQLRKRLIDKFGVDTDRLFDEFMKLVYGLDGKSLAQLIAPENSMARLALMLHALISGNKDKELAKAVALYEAINSSYKLFRRLSLEAYRACCDLESESFRHAIARLFFLHV
jgi:hypothetical protein